MKHVYIDGVRFNEETGEAVVFSPKHENLISSL